ncbi:MAG: Flp pilus assembly protein CpaB [Deltaproteobacteria bacterium]|nr:MAG: Flp pilus assembly protein CpaB [Deltaproteobacteria bacterium]
MARPQSSSRNRTILYLGAAVLAAAITAAVVAQVVKAYQRQVEAANARPELVRTVVAVRDLYMGLPITQEDVTIKELDPEMVPLESAFQSIDEVVGRTPRERILAHEIIRTERLARRDAGIGLNAIVTPGKRAMTVVVDTESGVAGFLQPNNYVDVIVTIRPDDEDIESKWLTETILQGVKVLAVDASLTSNAEAEEQKRKNTRSSRRYKPSVTLEVTLEEAEKLALASSKGDLHMVLRSDVDISPVETKGVVNINDVMGLTKDSKQPEKSVTHIRRITPSKPQPAATVDVISGSERKREEFDEHGNKIK